jgi:hypothetical protein
VRRQTVFLFVFLFALAGRAYGQQSQMGADLQGEGQRFSNSCEHLDLKSIEACAELLFTDHPFHIAVGSIAPQNGFGFGLAFVTHWTPNERWRLNWDADAVASNNGSWRAGVYMTAVYVPEIRIKQITPTAPGPAGTAPPKLPKLRLAVRTYPVFNLYAQAISLNQITYFGLGPNTTEADKSFFGMRETVVGANATVPIFDPLRLALYGEVNGRFVDIRPDRGQSSPSIEQVFTPVMAPGLTTQPAFAQFCEGIRMQPTTLGDHLRFDYRVTYQQFVAAGDSQFSFQRFTADLSNQIALYKNTRTLSARPFNGPDDCSEDQDDTEHKCPSITRDLEGSFGIRLLISESFTGAGHVVPFYFQPTLGGADISGSPSLGSYQDYRFRAPDIILLRGSFEHSIYGPLGVSLMVDEGKAVLSGSDLDFTHLVHSYSAGLTLRAGGFPQVWVSFAWGGHEGAHTIAQMNTSLLGGAARPSLY